jgi:putative ABC transport system permease protein
MQTFLQDLRYGVRMLVRNPGFSIAAILALVLGIGANTAIFSVVNALLLRALPYKNPESLVIIQSTNQKKPDPDSSVSFPDFNDWKDQNQVFEGLATFRGRGYTLTGIGDPERFRGGRVSAEFFDLLGIQPVLGRAFQDQDNRPESPRTVMLSSGLWQRRFGGDASLVNQTLTLDGESYTVIGILPSTFNFPFDVDGAEMWTPAIFDGLDLMQQRGAHFMKAIGRLKPGIAIETAQDDMETIVSRLAEQYPGENSGRGIQLTLLRNQFVGEGMRRALLILFAAVGFVLLIACSNVANLLLARATTRAKEISIRAALGATRARLARQMLTESVLLSVIGGGLGILLALWGVELLIKFSPANMPHLDQIQVDRWVLGFSLLLSILTGIIFGLAPTWKISRFDLNKSLKESGRGTSDSFSRNRLRQTLVVSQIAVSLLLLIGAGLTLKSFLRLQQVNPGFDASNVLTTQISLPSSKYPEGQQAVNFFHQVIGKIETLPGVEAVGGITYSPLSNNNTNTGFTIEKHPVEEGQEPIVMVRAVTPGYFQAMRIPIKQGRRFNEYDSRGRTGVAIINETLGQRYWADENPIGQRITLNLNIDDDEPTNWEIVGVMGDVKHTSIDSAPHPEVWIPHDQQAWRGLTLAIRTTTNPTSLATAIRNAVLSVNRDQPISSIQPMEKLVTDSIAQSRFYAILLGIFAGLALMLASIGIYGVMSYTINQRTQEIGIRLALGAQHPDVLKLVVGQGMMLAAIGLAIGILAAVGLTRLMTSLLFEVSATDPTIFIFNTLLLICVALVACYFPARRATSVDPMVALRNE